MSAPELPALPEPAALERAFAWLRQEGYSQLQFLPGRRGSFGPFTLIDEARLALQRLRRQSIVLKPSLFLELHHACLPPRLKLLGRLLYREETVPSRLARKLLGTDGQVLIDSGLVVEQAQVWHPRYRVVPYERLLMLGDASRLHDHPQAVDWDWDTFELADLLHQVPAGAANRVLDIGCGTGLQLLSRCQSGGSGCGFDVNPRAVGLSTLNAHVNAIGDVSFRLGSVEAAEPGPYHLIVWLPPGLPDTAMKVPHLNVAGGEEGWEVAVSCMTQAAPLLSAHGELWSMLCLFTYGERRSGHHRALENLAQTQGLRIRIHELFRFYPKAPDFRRYCRDHDVRTAHVVIVRLRRSSLPGVEPIGLAWHAAALGNLRCLIGRHPGS